MRLHPRLAPTAVLALALALLAGCSDTTSVEPPTRVVPDDYPTIQAAIDAAQPGEIVLVQPGVYSHLERRDVDPERYPGGILATAFMKEGIALIGNGDEGTVVLRDTTSADSSMGIVLSQLSAQPYVDNLAVENYGTGILVSRGDGTLQFLSATGCGVGLHLREPLEPIIRNSRLEGNDLGVLAEAGGGYLAATIVRNCTVGGRFTLGARIWVEANLFCSNGTGVILDDNAAPTFTLNAIAFNVGTGLATGDGAIPDLFATSRGAGLTFATGNDLYQNDVNFEVTGYDPPLSGPLDATHQFWDTVELPTVAAGIVDDRTDPGLGATVEYVPISDFSYFEFVFDTTPSELCLGGAPLSRTAYPAP